jgi:argininosuccinate synthase
LISCCFAIGRDIHVGDRSWNQRVDVGFEMQHLILVKASFARKSIQQVNSELQHKEYLSGFYGMHLHEGYIDPVVQHWSFLAKQPRKCRKSLFN